MCLRQVLYLEFVHRLIGQSWNKLMLLAIVDFVSHAMTVKAVAVFFKVDEWKRRNHTNSHISTENVNDNRNSCENHCTCKWANCTCEPNVNETTCHNTNERNRRNPKCSCSFQCVFCLCILFDLPEFCAYSMVCHQISTSQKHQPTWYTYTNNLDNDKSNNIKLFAVLSFLLFVLLSLTLLCWIW